MHGKRSTGAHEARLQTFVENYEIITGWYENAKAGIDRLPTGRDFADSLNEWDALRRRPTRSGIQFSMTKLMEAMQKRYEGNEVFGKFKSYKRDPAGAINLQLMIAHRVEGVRKKSLVVLIPLTSILHHLKTSISSLGLLLPSKTTSIHAGRFCVRTNISTNASCYSP